MVPDWYKSQMVNLASKGKVRIELMVTGGRECYCYKCSWNFNLAPMHVRECDTVEADVSLGHLAW